MTLYGPKQLADSMGTVRKNTILIAEDIPEKDYSDRPTSKSRSVAEILVHIASIAHFHRLVHEEQHLSSLEGFDFGAAFKKSETQEGLSRSKAEIIELLRTEGERWSRWVEQLSDDLLEEQVWMPGNISKDRFEMLLGTKEHEMQHRGQLTVIERLLGIVPHLTRNRQAASAVAAANGHPSPSVNGVAIRRRPLGCQVRYPGTPGTGVVLEPAQPFGTTRKSVISGYARRAP